MYRLKACVCFVIFCYYWCMLLAILYMIFHLAIFIKGPYLYCNGRWTKANTCPNITSPSSLLTFSFHLLLPLHPLAALFQVWWTKCHYICTDLAKYYISKYTEPVIIFVQPQQERVVADQLNSYLATNNKLPKRQFPFNIGCLGCQKLHFRFNLWGVWLCCCFVCCATSCWTYFGSVFVNPVSHAVLEDLRRTWWEDVWHCLNLSYTNRSLVACPHRLRQILRWPCAEHI